MKDTKAIIQQIRELTDPVNNQTDEQTAKNRLAKIWKIDDILTKIYY